MRDFRKPLLSVAIAGLCIIIFGLTFVYPGDLTTPVLMSGVGMLVFGGVGALMPGKRR